MSAIGIVGILVIGPTVVPHMLCGTSYLLYMRVSTIFRYTCDGLQTQKKHTKQWHKCNIFFYKKKLTAQHRCDVVVLCAVVTPQHNRSKILLLLLLCHVLWQKVATFYKKTSRIFLLFWIFFVEVGHFLPPYTYMYTNG